MKYLIHCIMYKGIGIEFCWVPSHCGLYWNEISDKLAKQGAVKNMSAVSSHNLLLSQCHIHDSKAVVSRFCGGCLSRGPVVGIARHDS